MRMDSIHDFIEHPEGVIAHGGVSSSIGRIYHIVKIREIDGFVLAVVNYDVNNGEECDFYALLAFPDEQGIGGRSVHQWSMAYFLGFYGSYKAANDRMLKTFVVDNVLSSMATIGPVPMEIWGGKYE